MTEGIIVAPRPSSALVVFTEESQTTIYAALHRKAAYAAGIEALALRAIETGEDAPLEHIAQLAQALSGELDQLASLVLQIKAAQA